MNDIVKEDCQHSDSELSKMALSKTDREEIIDIIRLTVNGKIDRLTISLEDHKEEMKPIVDGWRTVSLGRNFILWISATLASIGIIVTFFKT